MEFLACGIYLLTLLIFRCFCNTFKFIIIRILNKQHLATCRVNIHLGVLPGVCLQLVTGFMAGYSLSLPFPGSSLVSKSFTISLYLYFNVWLTIYIAIWVKRVGRQTLPIELLYSGGCAPIPGSEGLQTALHLVIA